MLVSEAVIRRCFVILQKRLQHRRFPVNFANFLKTPILTKHLWWLLLLCVVICFTKNEDYNLCKFVFNCNFIFTLLPYHETLITNSKHASLFQIDSPLQLNTYNISQPLFTCSNSSQLLVISLVKVKKSKGNSTVLFY